jgi:hypothetical protein
MTSVENLLGLTAHYVRRLERQGRPLSERERARVVGALLAVHAQRGYGTWQLSELPRGFFRDAYDCPCIQAELGAGVSCGLSLTRFVIACAALEQFGRSLGVVAPADECEPPLTTSDVRVWRGMQCRRPIAGLAAAFWCGATRMAREQRCRLAGHARRLAAILEARSRGPSEHTESSAERPRT